MNLSFQETVAAICKKDKRYHADAYYFLIEALDNTVKTIRKNQPDHGKHVSGQELLEGIKAYALDEFGPMAFAVLTEWGVRVTQDFGEIVFNLVRAGRLGKTESDSIEDFKDGFDFETAFRQPFEPLSPPAPNVVRGASKRRKRQP